MRLVGVTGKAGSGKDSIANWLMEHRRAYVVSFALPIKQALCVALSLDMQVFTDSAYKETKIAGLGRSPRYLAQTLGTEWGRMLVDPDVWVTACERKLRESHVWGAPDKLIVVPDVRFENEAKWVRQHGTLIHVRRFNATGNVGILGHASEGGVTPYAEDYLVENNGTLDELYAKIAVMFQRAPEPELADE